jgi:hypothetical protein
MCEVLEVSDIPPGKLAQEKLIVHRASKIEVFTQEDGNFMIRATFECKEAGDKPAVQ